MAVKSTQLAYRTIEGIGIFNTGPLYEPLENFVRPEGNFRCSYYSQDGKFFAWSSDENVVVVNASTGMIVATLPVPNVHELGFSPLGTYINTWQRPEKDPDGNTTKNLKVWRTTVVGKNELQGESVNQDPVGQFVQKAQVGWNLQYADDESFCARIVSNEVQFYNSANLGTVWNRLRVEGAAEFALAPGQTHAIAIFIPGKKGQPAAVKVFNVPQFASPVSEKMFYKGDKVQLKWNRLGTSLIVLTQTDVDKSNKSYYGETNMYILSASGGFQSRIHLDKEGPIHDVNWSPSSKEFGVVYGYMPAKTTIFNLNANATHEFPLAPRNTILFSPTGLSVLVAGFGNLSGQIDIYDLTRNYKKITTVEASNASVCEWGPDGTVILTATTSPRLRVDNGIRIWHITGPLLYNEDMNELSHVCWRPAQISKTADVNIHATTLTTPAPAPHASAVSYLAKRKSLSKPAGAYRPPGARGTSTPLHFKREDEGGAALKNLSVGGGTAGYGAGRGRRKEVPGAESINQPGVRMTTRTGEDGTSKAAVKNRKKREAKKSKDGEVVGGGANGYGSEAGLPIDDSQSGRAYEVISRRGPGADIKDNRPRADRTANNPTTSFPSPAVLPSSFSPEMAQLNKCSIAANDASSVAASDKIIDGKKIRSLLKKLRAIDELKMRQASGEALENTQIKKIATEGVIRQELISLNQAI